MVLVQIMIVSTYRISMKIQKLHVVPCVRGCGCVWLSPLLQLEQWKALSDGPERMEHFLSTHRTLCDNNTQAATAATENLPMFNDENPPMVCKQTCFLATLLGRHTLPFGRVKCLCLGLGGMNKRWVQMTKKYDLEYAYHRDCFHRLTRFVNWHAGCGTERQ